MASLIDNPLAVAGLCLLILLVVGVNAMLIGALRGRGGDSSGIGKVLSGMDSARKQREAEAERYAELSRRVAELKSKEAGRTEEGDGE